MDFNQIISLINKIGLICFVACAVLFLYRIIFILYGFKKDKPLKKTKKYAKFAILIPARNESKVIGKLLKSIKNQNYDKNLIDVYVVVENEDDPTINITQGYGYNVFVRKDLENKRTKGFALNEVVKDIYSKNLFYDAFLIFDADNVLKENFVTEMNKAYQAKYDVAFAYRNSVNIHDNWISLCSGLLFCNQNTFQNKAKSDFFNSILVSGTGYYISHNILDEYQGFPFNSLTEDAEFSKYCLAKNLKCKYIASTEFYDEQPTDFKTLCNQRLRWIKGFNIANKKYNGILFKNFFKKNSNKPAILESIFSLLANAFFVITFILYNLSMFTLMCVSLAKNTIFLNIILFNIFRTFLIYHFIINIFTMLQLFAERKHFTLSVKETFIALLMNPFFILSWIYNYTLAVFTKDVKWQVIKHTSSQVKLESENEDFSERELNFNGDIPEESFIKINMDVKK